LSGERPNCGEIRRPARFGRRLPDIDAGQHRVYTALSVADQGSTADHIGLGEVESASAEAIAAARDLVFEGLIEAGSLAESYSRSLTEAAWRGDRSTVEVHLRQLRACIVAIIGIFKQLDGVEAKGGGA
jgi:hypothetical protein